MKSFSKKYSVEKADLYDLPFLLWYVKKCFGERIY